MGQNSLDRSLFDNIPIYRRISLAHFVVPRFFLWRSNFLESRKSRLEYATPCMQIKMKGSDSVRSAKYRWLLTWWKRLPTPSLPLPSQHKWRIQDCREGGGCKNVQIPQYRGVNVSLICSAYVILFLNADQPNTICLSYFWNIEKGLCLVSLV